MVADRARVDDQYFGKRGVVDADMALTFQDAAHELGVRDVHLTTVGFDVVSL